MLRSGAPLRDVFRSLRWMSSRISGSFTKLTMPALSPTMKSGSLVSWAKAEGESVEPGDVLAEIETDKATVSFEAQESGFLAKILVPAGSPAISVGATIGIVVEEKEDIAAFGDIQEETSGSDRPSTEKKSEKELDRSKSGMTVAMGPAVAFLVSKHGLDVTQIPATGPGGRVLKGDVLKFIDSREANPQKGSKESTRTDPSKTTSPKQSVPSPVVQPSIPTGSLEYTDTPISTMRKIIAARLLESKTTIPHMYVSGNSELDNLIEARQSFNATAETKVSLNDCFVKAAGLALRRVPLANVMWDVAAQTVRKIDSVDISMAVAIEGGLITPIIRNADVKSIVEISKESKDLAKRARQNKLLPEEFQGGSFSISNLGMFGIKKFSAVINPPQACILAVGGASREIIPRDWELATQTISYFTLSSDARVVNEALASEFLSEFAELLQTPDKLLSQ